MPVWAWIAIVGGTLLVAAALVAASVLAWRSYERRVLLRLLVAMQGVEAAGDGLRDVVEHLALAADEQLETFADEPDSVERRALAELTMRAGILTEELDAMPLPARFQPVAEALADAAFLIGEQAGTVTDEQRGTQALESLGRVDLALVRGYTEKARTLLTGACEVCGLEDTAVYGGGLYL